jgi:hypothetical protein
MWHLRMRLADSALRRERRVTTNSVGDLEAEETSGFASTEP